MVGGQELAGPVESKGEQVPSHPAVAQRASRSTHLRRLRGPAPGRAALAKGRFGRRICWFERFPVTLVELMCLQS